MSRHYIPRSDRAYRPPRSSQQPSGFPQKSKKSSKQKVDSRQKHPILTFIIWIILIVSGISGLFFMSRWEYLEVKSIEIIGTDRLNPDRIESIVNQALDSQVNNWWNSRNVFLIPQRPIKNTIVQEEPSVSNVKVLRSFPDKVVVILEERYPIFELCSSSECIFLANDGVAIASGGNSSLITIQRDGINTVGEQIFSQRTIDWLQNIVHMYSIDLGLIIQEIEVVLEGESGILEIGLIIQDGYRIRLDFETDILIQKYALEAVFASEIPEEQRSNLEYIDLRVPNRVYYRFHNQEDESSHSNPDDNSFLESEESSINVDQESL